MKKLLLSIAALSFAASAWSCSCESSYQTPHETEIAHMAAENLGVKVASTDIVKFRPTLLERALTFGEEPNGGNCVYLEAGELRFQCAESFSGNILVKADSGCEVLMKIKRKKHTFSVKILSNSCQ